jgi:hypothetical protein
MNHEITKATKKERKIIHPRQQPQIASSRVIEIRVVSPSLRVKNRAASGKAQVG